MWPWMRPQGFQRIRQGTCQPSSARGRSIGTASSAPSPRTARHPTYTLELPDVLAPPGLESRESVYHGPRQEPPDLPLHRRLHRYRMGDSDGCRAVAGGVALLLQKRASLLPTEAFNLVTSFALREPQHGPFPNNIYGWGILDCKAALDAIPPDYEFTRDSLATFPPQARHLVRRPGNSEVHAVYTSGGSVFYRMSPDDGLSWQPSVFLSLGRCPAISLDYDGLPWVSYVRDNYLCFRSGRRAPPGTTMWRPEKCVWGAPGVCESQCAVDGLLQLSAGRRALPARHGLCGAGGQCPSGGQRQALRHAARRSLRYASAAQLLVSG